MERPGHSRAPTRWSSPGSGRSTSSSTRRPTSPRLKFGATREEISEAIAIAIGVNAAAIVDLSDVAAENTGIRLFDGNGTGR
jgi:hypothetical protein